MKSCQQFWKMSFDHQIQIREKNDGNMSDFVISISAAIGNMSNFVISVLAADGLKKKKILISDWYLFECYHGSVYTLLVMDDEYFMFYTWIRN